MSLARPVFGFAIGCLFLMQAGVTPARAASAIDEIAYVPTRHDIVRDMLWVAGVGIVRTNDGYAATLFDKGKQIQVEDFYDFGGGFYFTHMVDKVEASPGVWSV